MRVLWPEDGKNLTIYFPKDNNLVVADSVIWWTLQNYHK